MRCWLHEDVLTFEGGRLRVRCLVCGRLSKGVRFGSSGGEDTREKVRGVWAEGRARFASWVAVSHALYAAVRGVAGKGEVER